MNKATTYKFRLYVADDTQNSALARANLTALCRKYLPDRHEIDVVDIFREPQRARADGIRTTPTLIKLSPHPVRKIVGTLGHTERVLLALDLEDVAA